MGTCLDAATRRLETYLGISVSTNHILPAWIDMYVRTQYLCIVQLCIRVCVHQLHM